MNDQEAEIGDLPVEVLGLILNKLTQNEVLIARLVCQNWQSEVDKHYNEWIIALDDRAPPDILEHILKLRIRACKIKSYLTSLPPSIDSRRIFKQPKLVKTLTALQENEEEDKTKELTVISGENLHFLLKCCSKNLHELRLVLGKHILIHPFPYEDLMEYSFQNVELLELNCELRTSSSLKIDENNLLHQMISVPIPHLTSVDVNLSGYHIKLSKYESSKLSLDLLSFVANHGEHLEAVTVDLYFDESSNESLTQNLDFDTLDLNLLKEITCLERLNFSLPYLVADSVAAAWRQLVMQQTELVNLEVYGLTIAVNQFKNLVQSNWETLTSIEIDDLKVPILNILPDTVNRPLLDVTFLECCPHLKHLRLGSDQSGGIPDPIISNLLKLPESITELELAGITIVSTDIIEFIQNRKQQLSSLDFYLCGDEGEYLIGVNGSVLEECLSESNPNLQQVKICTFNTWNNIVELRKLQSILEQFDCPRLKSYENAQIGLKRDPNLGTWILEESEFDVENSVLDPIPTIPDYPESPSYVAWDFEYKPDSPAYSYSTDCNKDENDINADRIAIPDYPESPGYVFWDGDNENKASDNCSPDSLHCSNKDENNVNEDLVDILDSPDFQDHIPHNKVDVVEVVNNLYEIPMVNYPDLMDYSDNNNDVPCYDPLHPEYYPLT